MKLRAMLYQSPEDPPGTVRPAVLLLDRADEPDLLLVSQESMALEQAEAIGLEAMAHMRACLVTLGYRRQEETNGHVTGN